MSIYNGIAYRVDVNQAPYNRLLQKDTNLLHEFDLEKSLEVKNTLITMLDGQGIMASLTMLCFLNQQYNHAERPSDWSWEKSDLFYNYLSEQLKESSRPILPLERCKLKDDGTVLKLCDFPVFLHFLRENSSTTSLIIKFNDISKEYQIPVGVKYWKIPYPYIMGSFDTLKFENFPENVEMWGSLMIAEDRVF